MKGIQYQFTAEVWRYEGPNGWYFVSLPAKYSAEIRKLFGDEEEGWGRLKVTARIEATEWRTAIWFDLKKGTYLLPLKAEIRNKYKIQAGDRVELKVCV